MVEIIEKVQKLLALSKDNPSEGETKAAMLAAQRLMAQHNLTMADIEVDPLSPKEVIEGLATEWKRLTWWYKSLSITIAQNFRCHTFIRKSGRGSSAIVFLGLKEDVELAKQVYSFAINSIKYHADKFIRHTRSQGLPIKGVRNDYIIGFLQGLDAQFKEQVENNEWGLVLVKDADVEEAFNKLKLRKSNRSRISTAGNNQAKDAGYRQGRSWQSPSGALN